MNSSIDATFVTYEPKWVLVIVESSGRRDLPLACEVNTYVVEDEEFLFNKILQANGRSFKIYDIPIGPEIVYSEHMNTWKGKAILWKREKEENLEREQYERLKKKFGDK